MLRKLIFITLFALTTLVYGPGFSKNADVQLAQAVTIEAYGTLDTQPSSPSDELTPEDYARVAQELSMLSGTQISINRLRDRMIKLMEQAPNFPGDVITLLNEKSPTGNANYLAAAIFWTLIFLYIGSLVQTHVYGARLVGPWFLALQKPNPDGIVEKLPILAIRALLGVGGIIIATTIAALLAFGFLDPADEVTQKTVLLTLATVSASRISIIFWRMIVSPYLPHYRIPCMPDADAKKLFSWLWITVAFSFSLLALCYWLEDIGISLINHQLMLIFASLLTLIAGVMMVSANRAAINDSILGTCNFEQANLVQRVSTALWAPFTILYLISSWLVLTYRILTGQPAGAPLIVSALIIVLAVILAYGIVAYGIARLFQRGRAIAKSRAIARENDLLEEEQERIVTARNVEGDPLGDDGDEDSGPSAIPAEARARIESAPEVRSMRDFEDLAKRTASIVAMGAGIYALIQVWDYGFLLEDGRFLDRVEGVIDICLVGYIIYHAVRIWIDTRIEEEGGFDLQVAPGDEGGGASSASRLATLLPLFRNFMLFTIFITLILMVLLEIGINVAPLFAGAGVVGIAIGFGAQTLIRDILSGAFYLFDDAFRKGEYIDIGSVKGTVEKISVRSFQLRHHLGALHTVPFGEITHLTNYSRDWVMMKLPLRVTYDTDVEKVRKLVKKLGQELLDHPLEGPKFLQPLKSQGVYKMEDSAMIIRVKFMTRPGDQWTTRKLVYSRLRELFEANGVKFAHREVTVRIPPREQGMLTDDEQEAVAAAAHRATVAADDAMGPRRVASGDDR